jgi:hypothetical protein
VWDELEGMAADQSDVIGLLDDWIARLEDLTWLGIGIVVDGTACDLVYPHRAQYAKWPPSCRASHAECTQLGWLQASRMEATAVLNTLDAMVTTEVPDPKLAAVLREVVVDGKSPLGLKRCWAMGDLLIALDGAGVGAIVSSNQRDFAPLAHALRFDLVTYQP